MRCEIPALSKLFVGSSSKSRSGSCMRADANKSLACCPPEKDFINLSFCAGRFTARSTASILGSMAYTFSGKHFSKNSRTVNGSSCCKITCLECAIVSSLLIFACPEVGLRFLVRSKKSVDFPAPFWPITVVFEPKRNEKLTSSKIGLLCPYSNDTLSNEIMVSCFCTTLFVKKICLVLVHLFLQKKDV